MQELIERALLVVAECAAVGETVLAIQRERRVEGGARSRFEGESRVSSQPSFRDDVLENRRRHSAAQMRIGRAHRFDLAGPRVELLQRADAEKVFAFPQ